MNQLTKHLEIEILVCNTLVTFLIMSNEFFDCILGNRKNV